MCLLQGPRTLESLQCCAVLRASGGPRANIQSSVQINLSYREVTFVISMVQCKVLPDAVHMPDDACVLQSLG